MNLTPLVINDSAPPFHKAKKHLEKSFGREEEEGEVAQREREMPRGDC